MSIADFTEGFLIAMRAMPPISLRCCLILLLAVSFSVLASGGRVLSGEPEPTGQVDFNRDIRPILSNNCFFCHGPDRKHREAGLRLDTREGLLDGRDGTAAVVPGKPGESELFGRIGSDDEFMRMPPADTGKQLDPEQIDLIRRWIEQGAEWREHWAYVSPERPPLPEVENTDWPVGAIDRFVLARLEQEGLEPSPEADRRTLVRRLSFDLTGLPPTPEDVDEFVEDEAPGAYERLVDRLLASPHFGERMAIHWLDLVRYADTVGYHGDQEHHISPYRDYVIKAFNENLPFDQFTVEQLAGDLLPEPTLWQTVATGYNRVLQTSHEGGVQVKEYLAKYSADRVRNVSSVWMGATLGCAECHDHKYDPYTIDDFYSFAAFFADVDDMQTFRGRDRSPTRREPEMPAWNLSQYGEMKQIGRVLARLQERLDSGDESGEIGEQIEALQARKDEIEEEFQPTMITVSVEPRPIRVLARGDWMDESGEVVEPAVPRFLAPLETDDRATRLDLAEWFVSRENPLTARVFVNRLWKMYFGMGLSRSLDDFGAQGEPPVHPELLDWLAVEFMEPADPGRAGPVAWDVKHIVREIVLSRAYRQSSLETPELRQRDPENRLLARQSRWRLEAEFVRDNALALSGLLVRNLGGRSVRPYQPEGYYRHLNFPRRTYEHDTDENQYRRGLYMHWQRVFLHPMLKAFDAPSREECTAERPASNTPLASLVLLNDPSFIEAARALGVRIIREGGEGVEDRVRWAWREALSREPDERELAVLCELFEQDLEEYAADPDAARRLLGVGLAAVPDEIDPAELAAWTSAARAVLNLNETMTRN